MTENDRLVRIVHSENPIREIWSMLGFFESEYNAETYLKKEDDYLPFLDS
jgi:hypothetical protein